MNTHEKKYLHSPFPIFILFKQDFAFSKTVSTGIWARVGAKQVYYKLAESCFALIVLLHLLNTEGQCGHYHTVSDEIASLRQSPSLLQRHLTTPEGVKIFMPAIDYCSWLYFVLLCQDWLWSWRALCVSCLPWLSQMGWNFTGQGSQSYLGKC